MKQLMTIKQRPYLVIVVAIALICFCFGAIPVHAESTNFKQQIFPLNCVFEVINDGLGTIHFLTPKECGVIIPSPPVTPSQPAVPSPTNQQTPLQPYYGYSYQSSPTEPNIDQTNNNPANPLPRPGKGQLLNYYPEFSEDQGKSLWTAPGDSFYYKIPADNYKKTYPIYIYSVDKNVAQLVFFSGSSPKSIKLGEKLLYDSNQDGKADLAVSYISYSNGTAELNFKLAGSTTTNSDPQFVYIILIIIMLALLLLLRRRRRQPEDEM